MWLRLVVCAGVGEAAFELALELALEVGAEGGIQHIGNTSQ